MRVVLRIDSLYKDFSGLQVLSGVSIDFSEGERHVVIGPNGAGKTTLFNIISGLYESSRGRIYFLDKDITHYPPHRIARLGSRDRFRLSTSFPG